MPDKIVLGVHTILTNAQNQGSSAAFIDGHAWLTITENGRTTAYGLWPDEHPIIRGNGLDNGSGSDIRTGIESSPGYPSPTASRYIELTPEQYRDFQNELRQNVTWGKLNNCSDWATNTYNRVSGEKLDASELLIASTPRELTDSIRALERVRATSKDNPAPPVPPKKSIFDSFFSENTQINEEVKAVYAKLHDGLADKIANAGAEKFTDPMLAEATYACVKNGLTANNIGYADINTDKNTILVNSQDNKQFAAVDAFAAAKTDPATRLQEASQLQDSMQQQQTLAQTQQVERQGPTLS